MHVGPLERAVGGGSGWEMELRRLAASEQDTARGMFFLGVLDVVGFVGGDAVAERCMEECGTRELDPFHMYPVARFLKMTSTAARLLWPQLDGWEGVLRRMGTQATVDYLASMFGRELMQAAAGNPRRLLPHLIEGYRAAVSYGERHVEWTGDRSARFVMRRDFMPAAYHEGVLQGVLEAVGARDVSVRGRQLALLDSEYDLSWS
ncbi:TIGR02265 family protein [Myxococcaceae bacterium JPH2]|nr:TIGR02265 family protein [Myxococcaceae bacterium JPH2]